MRVTVRTWRFPDPDQGIGPDGALCIGADLEPETLLYAYGRGIFPWPAPERGIVVWCSPDPRAVLPLQGPPHVSRSLRRTIRSGRFRVTVDRAFREVVASCADRRGGTWITPEYAASFALLHEAGHAHSLEVWNAASGALAGGIYGLAVGAVFSAESMFHRETDASKVAFVALAERLRPSFSLLDGEVPSPHLDSLGCIEMPRSEFLAGLAERVGDRLEFPTE